MKTIEQIVSDLYSAVLSHVDSCGIKIGLTNAFGEILKQALAQREQWQPAGALIRPLGDAPVGYDGEKFNHVIFVATSKSGAFSGRVYVSGWMDHHRKPVHNYSYALNIIGWMPLPTAPITKESANAS